MATADEMAEMIRLELENAAQAKSDADRLEALRKRVFSQLVVSFAADNPVSKAEHMARSDPRYVQAEDHAIDAQTRANLSEAKVDGMKLAWETWRTRAANKRAEMQIR